VDELAGGAVDGAPANILDRALVFLGSGPVEARLGRNSVLPGPGGDTLAHGHCQGEPVPLVWVLLFIRHCHLPDVRAIDPFRGFGDTTSVAKKFNDPTAG